MDSLKELYLAAGGVNCDDGGISLPEKLEKFEIKLMVIPEMISFHSVERYSEVTFRVPLLGQFYARSFSEPTDAELTLPLQDINRA